MIYIFGCDPVDDITGTINPGGVSYLPNSLEADSKYKTGVIVTITCDNVHVLHPPGFVTSECTDGKWDNEPLGFCLLNGIMFCEIIFYKTK